MKAHYPICPKKIIVIFWAICLFSTLTAHAEDTRPAYRMPISYNPNPVGGRLYLQPIDTHEDQCIEGFEAEIAYGEASEYNIYFVEKKTDPKMTVNSRISSAKASYGHHFLGYGIETGATLRVHQDERETLLSNMLKNYHEIIGFGNIPEDDAYYGRIGNNQMDVIGENGDIFLTTLQMYAKIQLLEDGGEGTRIPNVSVKSTFRTPLSGKPYDTEGGAFSLGLSKKVTRNVFLIGALGVIFQDIDDADFEAENLHVDKWAGDALAGLVWDMGKEGGWYMSAALRGSSERVRYRINPDSAGNAYCVHLLGAYRKPLNQGGLMEIFINCNENIPDFGNGLEPDFCVQTGVSVRVF